MDNLFIDEMMSLRSKREYADFSEGLTGERAQNTWRKMGSDEYGHFDASSFNNEKQIEKLFSQNCILYFPPNRFEEPAWLNEENLKTKAEYMNLKHLRGYTNRKIINYSPLKDNQNWLFEVLYDRGVFEPNFVSGLYSKNDDGNFHPMPAGLASIGHTRKGN